MALTARKVIEKAGGKIPFGNSQDRHISLERGVIHLVCGRHSESQRFTDVYDALVAETERQVRAEQQAKYGPLVEAVDRAWKDHSIDHGAEGGVNLMIARDAALAVLEGDKS